MNDFDRALAFVFRWEGGTSDEPDDRGGRTSYGVTQGTYEDWLRDQGLPKQDVWKITREVATVVYREKFWWVAKEDPWPLNLVLMDVACHHGPGRATEWLEQVSWANATPDEKAWAILCIRRQFMLRDVAKNPKQKRWIRGWTNRLNDLAKVAGLVPGTHGGSTEPQVLASQRPKELPKLDVASSTLVARSTTNPPDSKS